MSTPDSTRKLPGRSSEGQSGDQVKIDRRSLLAGSLGFGTGLLTGQDRTALAQPGSALAREKQKGLGGLSVTEVDIRMFTWPVSPGVDHDGRAREREVELGLVTVRTGDGGEGYAFLGAHRMSGDRWAGDVLEYFKPALLGQNPLDIGRHWHTMWNLGDFILPHVVAPLDIALWDLAGKIMGQPIHRLLGTCRNKVPAYASSAPLMEAERYAEEAQHYRSLGWQAYKLHPRKNPGEDIELCRAVRRAVGPMVLMLDSMWAYGFEDAVRVGRTIEELDYYWYEDPLPRNDVYGNAKLCAELDIPVMATELAHGGPYGLQQYITQRATDILRADAALKGGITPLVKIMHMAETFGMKCEIHHAGNALNNVANLHVTMASMNCDYFEVLLPHDLHAYGLVEDIVVDREGYVRAPEGPGLGFEIDWDLVKKRTTRVLS